MGWFYSNLKKDEDGDVADAFFIADEEDDADEILSVRPPPFFPPSRPPSLLSLPQMPNVLPPSFDSADDAARFPSRTPPSP